MGFFAPLGQAKNVVDTGIFVEAQVLALARYFEIPVPRARELLLEQVQMMTVGAIADNMLEGM